MMIEPAAEYNSTSLPARLTAVGRVSLTGTFQGMSQLVLINYKSIFEPRLNLKPQLTNPNSQLTTDHSPLTTHKSDLIIGHK